MNQKIMEASDIELNVINTICTELNPNFEPISNKSEVSMDEVQTQFKDYVSLDDNSTIEVLLMTALSKTFGLSAVDKAIN